MEILIKILVGTIIGLWLVLLVGVLMYRFEGHWFPVTSQLNFNQTDIVRYYEKEGGWSLVAGDFEKLRDCTFKGIEWYYVQGGGEVDVQAYFEDKPQVRGEGNHSFERLAVRITSPQSILNNSRVVVLHDCWNGWLWMTRTEFITPNNG